MMKTLFSICVSFLFAFVIYLPCAAAQDEPKSVNGGVLNGKATSLPKPEYPAAARMSGVSGAVAVNVIIDIAGTVISAEADMYQPGERKAENGTKLDPVLADPNLREAAEQAALQARFSPTFLNGQPIQVKG